MLEKERQSFIRSQFLAAQVRINTNFEDISYHAMVVLFAEPFVILHVYIRL